MEDFVVKSPKDIMYLVGLGKPWARGITALTVSAGILYIARMPPGAFKADGSIREFAPISKADDAVTYSHFLVLPLVIGAGVFLFT